MDHQLAEGYKAFRLDCFDDAGGDQHGCAENGNHKLRHVIARIILYLRNLGGALEDSREIFRVALYRRLRAWIMGALLSHRGG